jgi:hypothetical protein
VVLLVVLALLVAGWVGLALATGGGTDPQAFRQAVAKTTQGALSAVRTAQLAGQARLSGKLLDTALAPILDNSVRGVATAQEELAGTPPADSGQVAVRDQLVGLLDQAARTVDGLVAAFDRGDDSAARAAVGALGPLGDRLDDFLEGHRP